MANHFRSSERQGDEGAQQPLDSQEAQGSEVTDQEQANFVPRHSAQHVAASPAPNAQAEPEAPSRSSRQAR